MRRFLAAALLAVALSGCRVALPSASPAQSAATPQPPPSMPEPLETVEGVDEVEGLDVEDTPGPPSPRKVKDLWQQPAATPAEAEGDTPPSTLDGVAPLEGGIDGL